MKNTSQKNSITFNFPGTADIPEDRRCKGYFNLLNKKKENNNKNLLIWLVVVPFKVVDTCVVRVLEDGSSAGELTPEEEGLVTTWVELDTMGVWLVVKGEELVVKGEELVVKGEELVVKGEELVVKGAWSGSCQ